MKVVSNTSPIILLFRKLLSMNFKIKVQSLHLKHLNDFMNNRLIQKLAKKIGVQTKVWTPNGTSTPLHRLLSPQSFPQSMRTKTFPSPP